ncbi:Serine/Threonine kinase domain protein (macronuclear) [Tetrahymena thermophila SB210]|uniref:Serine/Threonine kinase domain protein n=1 Tax=Tetrahymena thermophila (strain SB210) TaxID=312017 RepID=Q23EA3_TETTS|nr:Serine/Threonine kinase domain protein [Tetrahymena thermophila SB210]EAR94850.2 Serine/Threonine kinase domain protein [Tetrahymena thermophila SB210]|eukprot:XP_001015095.2 Serine/Threonine kinase domain protein [Tetrahymena thermophila SB210]
MGNICKKTSFIGYNDNYQKITINDFECSKKQVGREWVEEIIGQGGFGVVKRVRKKGEQGPTYAMKMMEKYQVSKKNNIQTTLNEMFILRDIQHPFLINMKWAFHDETYLYLVMEELKGYDLHFHLVNFKLKDDLMLKQKYFDLEQKKVQLERIKKNTPDTSKGAADNKKIEVDPSCFTENQARFIIAQLCLALNYLHNNKIIHKDIKPANIIFEDDGYLRVTDLGISKKFRPNNNVDISGTPGYIAPEVLCRQNHNYAVDYYAVGVICYELMLTKKPYENDKPEKDNYNKELLKNILQSQIEVVPYKPGQKPGQIDTTNPINGITKVVAPQDWSNEGIDFMNQCLQRQPTKRIGYDNIEKVLEHNWFRDIDFDRLAAKKYKNIPFNQSHIQRSIKRSKLFKFLQEQIQKYDEDIERENQKKNDVDSPTETNGSDYSQDREEKESKAQKQIQQLRLQQLYKNQQQDIQNQQQEQQRKLLEQQMEEQDKMNQKKLQNIQHFFKQYYFDRERYEKEVKYLEQERRKLEQGKKVKSNQNLSDFQSNSPKRSQVLYGKQNINNDTNDNNIDDKIDFPDIIYEKKSQEINYNQYINQSTFNQQVANPRQSIINLQQVSNNPNLSFTTQPDSQASSRRLNDSSRSDVNNTSFLSRSRNNQDQRQIEMQNQMISSKSPQIDPNQIHINTNPQNNNGQNKIQSRNIFQANLSSIADKNQYFNQ